MHRRFARTAQSAIEFERPHATCRRMTCIGAPKYARYEDCRGARRRRAAREGGGAVVISRAWRFLDTRDKEPAGAGGRYAQGAPAQMIQPLVYFSLG